MNGPLTGITVVDIAGLQSGQFAGRLLADLGARVVKVEPEHGDPLRRRDDANPAAMHEFSFFNGGKLSLCLGEGGLAHDVMAELVMAVDVVIDSPTRSGTGPFDDFLDRHPLPTPAVRCSVTPFGRTGPLSGRLAGEAVIQALSSNASMTGPPAGPPYLTSTGYPFTATGMHACVAILNAIRMNRHENGGSELDIAMLDVMFAMDVENVPLAVAERGEYDPPRLGNLSEQDTLALYRSAQGYIVMEVYGSGANSMWGRLAQAMERPDLITDPRFVDDTARVRAWDVLIPIVESWLQTFPTDDDALRVLDQAGVVCGRILPPTETVKLDHVSARHSIVRPDPDGLPMIAPPWRFSLTPARAGKPPALGEHTCQVLREVCQFSEAHVQDLLARRAAFAGSTAQSMPNGSPA